MSKMGRPFKLIEDVKTLRELADDPNVSVSTVQRVLGVTYRVIRRNCDIHGIKWDKLRIFTGNERYKEVALRCAAIGSQSVVARELGLSRQRVSDMVKKAKERGLLQ